jgi:hypothetical protein
MPYHGAVVDVKSEQGRVEVQSQKIHSFTDLQTWIL